MTDLLAIIDHGGRLIAHDVAARFLRDYEALRGQGRTSWASTAGSVVAAVIEHGRTESAGVDSDSDGSWTAWAGRPIWAAPRPTKDLSAVDGQFALVRRLNQGAGWSVEVATDPFGMKPCFTASNNGRTYVSTSMNVIARHLGAELDDLEATRFIRTGQQFGRTTLWNGIERLEPGAVLEFDERGHRVARTYWRPQIDGSARGLDLREATSRAVGHVEKAVELHEGDGDRWLDLTGGFDSRLLALAARDRDIHFRGNTTGDATDADVLVASRVAQAIDAPWERFSIEPDWVKSLPDALPTVVAWGDGRLDALQLSEVLFTHERKGLTQPVLWNGGGGEHFRAVAWGTDASLGLRMNLDHWIRWRVLSSMDTGIFAEDPTKSVVARCRELLGDHLRSYRDAPASAQLDLVYALKVTGHFGAYAAAGGRSLRVDLPFYSREAFNFCISVAPARRRLHRLQRHMLREFDADIAAIPTDEGGPGDPMRLANAHRFLIYLWRRSQRLRRPLVGRTPAPTPTQELRVRGRQTLLASLRDRSRLTHRSLLAGHLYSAEEFDRLIERCLNGSGEDDWATLGRIVTLEETLRLTSSAT